MPASIPMFTKDPTGWRNGMAVMYITKRCVCDEFKYPRGHEEKTPWTNSLPGTLLGVRMAYPC